MSTDDHKPVLVTGATGYVGGRLIPRLLEQGYRVRVFVRDAERMADRSWSNQVEICQGDIFDPDTLKAPLEGVRHAYYLIHSMSGNEDFHERDLTAARNFGRLAADAGVEQIIYLGGLGDPDSDLSKHLESRQKTGEALREGGRSSHRIQGGCDCRLRQRVI